VPRELVVTLDGKNYAVTNANLAAGNLHLNIDGKPYSALTGVAARSADLVHLGRRRRACHPDRDASRAATNWGRAGAPSPLVRSPLAAGLAR